METAKKLQKVSTKVIKFLVTAQNFFIQNCL